MTAVLAPVSDAAAFGRKTAALLSARSEHLPRVLDVTALGGHRELVLEALDGPTLGGLMAHRRRVTPGEAVTVVIGAVRAVAALHAAGYCGVDLGPDGIRFDTDGRPVIVGVDALRETIEAGTSIAGDDWRAVGALADRLGIVAHGRAGGALGPAQVGLGLALAAVAGQESALAIERLEDALFEVAEPAAVRLTATDDAEGSAHTGGASHPFPARRARASHRLPSGSRMIEAFEAGPSALMAGPRERLRALVQQVAGRMSGRAKLFALAGAIAAVLTVGAVLALSPGNRAAQSGAHRGASSVGATAPSAARPTPDRATPAARPKPGPTAGRAAALTGADPVAAATVLLTARDACLDLADAARVNCLNGVADGAASALDDPARPLAGLTPSLLERTGATALIALTPKDAKTSPASALLMRTEAGWRLRRLYEN